MEGGATNVIPRLGKEIPVPQGTQEKDYPKLLQQQVDFFDIESHGALVAPDDPGIFLIPDNTWVIFFSRTGEESSRNDELIPELIDFRYLRENETEEEWYTRINKGIQEGTLFKNLTYSSEYNYKPSIYEPGDVVNDLDLLFLNKDHSVVMPAGLWNMPAEFEYREIENHWRTIFINAIQNRFFNNENIQKMFNRYKDYKELVMIQSSLTLTIDEKKEAIDKLDLPNFIKNDKFRYISLLQEMYEYNTNFTDYADDPVSQKYRPTLIRNKMKYNEDVFLLSRKNILPKQTSNIGFDVNVSGFKRNFTLSDILKKKDIHKSNKPYRIFIILSCRSAYETHFNKEQLEITRTMSEMVRQPKFTPVNDTCIIPKVFTNKQTLLEYKDINEPIKRLINGENITLNEFKLVLKNSKNIEHVKNAYEQQQRPDSNIISLTSSEYLDPNTGAPRSNSFDMDISNGGKRKRKRRTYRKKKLRRQTRKHT